MDLKVYWEDIFNLANEVANLQFIVKDLEEQIAQSELWKKLTEAKLKLAEYNQKEEEFKQMMFDWMINSWTEKVETAKQIFTIRNNPPAVNVINEDLIPDEYKKVKVDIDKTKIKNAIKEWKVVEWVEITQWKSLLITVK